MTFPVFSNEMTVLNLSSIFFALISRAQFCPVSQEKPSTIKIATGVGPSDMIGKMVERTNRRFCLRQRVQIQQMSQHVVMSLTILINQGCEGLIDVQISG